MSSLPSIALLGIFLVLFLAGLIGADWLGTRHPNRFIARIAAVSMVIAIIFELRICMAGINTEEMSLFFLATMVLFNISYRYWKSAMEALDLM